MRTLFLVGILTTLVAIAFKQPDQTAWQVASQFADRFRVVAKEIPAPKMGPRVEPIVTAEPAPKPAAGSPTPRLLNSQASEAASPAIAEQNQKPEAKDPLPRKTNPPVEVRTPKIPEAPEAVPEATRRVKLAEATEPSPKAMKSEMEAVEPQMYGKSATALPELAEIEVKSVPVHFPKEGPLDGAIQSSAQPSTDYGVIQRRYRNTIAILGKIQ